MVVKAQETLIEVGLDFHIPDDMPALLANEMVVQTVHGIITMSFFEVKLPLMPTALKTSNGKKHPPTVKALCRARVSLSIDRIPEVITALQSQVDAHSKRKETNASSHKKTTKPKRS